LTPGEVRAEPIQTQVPVAAYTGDREGAGARDLWHERRQRAEEEKEEQAQTAIGAGVADARRGFASRNPPAQRNRMLPDGRFLGRLRFIHNSNIVPANQPPRTHSSGRNYNNHRPAYPMIRSRRTDLRATLLRPLDQGLAQYLTSSLLRPLARRTSALTVTHTYSDHLLQIAAQLTAQ
jgi:hypothetical protein